jgi:hypothetical protein
MTRGSGAASGWAGWALAHLEFGSSVNPITTRGADYAYHITANPRGFENPVASLRGTSILGEVRNVKISRATQQLLNGKSHDFQAVFALAHSKINWLS